VQRSLMQSFTEASVVNNKQAGDLKDASPATRLKAFGIDGIIMVVGLAILRAGWQWLLKPVLFGSENSGIYASIVSFNLSYPLILCFAYFLAFWYWRGATPGQISTHTAVIMDDGRRLDFATAAKRSALFVASTLIFFGIPSLSLFLEMKKTLFDYFCGTRVVE
jgi:uncharacterized RDD family membrane protein YckC